MEQLGASSVAGNTKATARSYQTFTWCLTWNNYPKDALDCLSNYVGASGAFVLGRETGESGTPHIQGVIKFSQKKRLETLHTAFPQVHWEKCKSWKASIIYCSKDGNFIEQNSGLRIPPRDPLTGLELYGWQSEIINIMNREPDRRTIHWYYDEVGCSGKTTLAKSICIRNPKSAIVLSGKANDIKCGVSQFIKNNGSLRVAIFHFVRSLENFISYEALESIKDGIFYSGKYESEMCIFDSPHVFVFANFRPDTTKMSGDRWRITKI